MFRRRTPVLIALLILAAHLLPSTAAASGRRGSTIVELAQGSPDLSILVDAVIAADLVETLAEGGPFTVFAPTNEAFLAALDQLGFDSLEDVPVDTLRGILLDHVVDGEQRARRLRFLDLFDRNLDALGGLTLEFDRAPLAVNGIDVVIRDLRARNGVVHVIDEVLLDPDPRPSITDLAIATPQLSILVDAAVRTGLDKVLDAGSPFTVFAPTNEAFLALLDALGLDSLDDVPDGTLVNILLDHIVSLELDDVDIRRRLRTQALGRLRLTIDGRRDEVNGIPILSDGIEAFNGTVYLIDGVLLDD